jgi:hypothetical protein
MLNTSVEFSVDREFIEAADRLVQGKPHGYAINPGPVETKTPIFGIFTDKVCENCLFVLARWMDGTGIFLRYPKHLVRVATA